MSASDGPPCVVDVVAVPSLIAAAVCGAIISLDEIVHPQRMWIMNVVWPVVALWAGPLGLLAYFVIGRQSARTRDPGQSDTKPFWQQAALVVAFVFGIGLQYFTIVPMRQLSPGQGIIAAIKADALSLAAWQIGMYGWMAIALFVLFSEGALPKTSARFWFMMQLAMCLGFLVSYPVNWWLLSTGFKEAM